MTSPLVLSDTGAPSALHGLHGGRGVDRWKRFVTGLMLHARALAFPHPAGGTKRLEAEPPADMAGLTASLGLSQAG